MTSYGRRTRRTVVGIALAGALTAGLASCGTGTGDAKPDGRLSGALDGIPQDAAGGYLTYWDVKESRQLLGKDKELYGTLDGYGQQVKGQRFAVTAGQGTGLPTLER